MSHLNDFVPLWTEAVCVVKLPILEKLWSQTPQFKGSCTSETCILKACFGEQLCLHKWHSNICDHNFSKKANVKIHIAEIHNGKKVFECHLCKHSCWVHEVKKPLKYGVCDQTFSKMGNLTTHTASVHNDPG